MTDKTKSKTTLTLNKTLQLKKSVESDSVRQSFAHGRSKTVTVEVKRKRIFSPDGTDGQTVNSSSNISKEIESLSTILRDHNLTEGEFDARKRALEAALKRQAEEEEQRQKQRQIDEENANLKALEEATTLPPPSEPESSIEDTVPEDTDSDTDLQGPSLEELNTALEVDHSKITIPLSEKNKKPVEIKPKARDLSDEEEFDAKKKGISKLDIKKVVIPKKDFDQPRRINRNFIERVLSSEDGDAGRTRSLASIKRARQKDKSKNQQGMDAPQKVVREVIIPDTISVQELSNRMAVRGADVIKELMKLGMMVTINQLIDADTAELICTEFGHKFKRVSDEDIVSSLGTFEDNPEDLRPRAPVVTIMGHVDHGKTSLLDALRKTDVVSGEAGGITQHIGAYQITLKSGEKITFIDTPGHAAFSQMRARGAQVTDIIILVVAADDGVNQQTIEAISHAKAANVPIIVAINKIDKPEADPARVRQELLTHDIVLEDFGGDVMAVEVSAKKGINLEKLEETILLQAEILELQANPNRPAQGIVIESQIDRGRGAISTVLVQHGQLKPGDSFVAGSQWGRVKALINDHGKRIHVAGPSLPVEVLGFDSVPKAGDEFFVVESDTKAREIAEFRTLKERTARTLNTRGSMEQIMSQIAMGEAKELPLVVKADVQGSLEAIQSSLNKLATSEVKIRFLHGGVGAINESDITLARASNGIVIGFNVRANQQARDLAKRDNVDIRYYSIIYNIIDEMKAVMSGLLAPTVREKFLGTAEIREVFSISKLGKIAGCFINEGLVKRGGKVRLLRDNVVIHEGELKTLRRFKDEVKEVKHGYECGMAFENYNDIAVGDVIECFEMESVAREL